MVFRPRAHVSLVGAPPRRPGRGDTDVTARGLLGRREHLAYPGSVSPGQRVSALADHRGRGQTSGWERTSRERAQEARATRSVRSTA
jgi:hypothetical protein